MSKFALIAQARNEAPVVDPFPSGPIGDPEGDYPTLTASAGQNADSGPPPAGSANMLADPGRALRWYFTGEDVTIAWSDGSDLATWDLRDYDGNIVASGTSPTSPLNLGPLPIGWYKLYLHRATDLGPPWGTSGGEASFIVSRTAGILQDTPLPSSAISGGGSAYTTVPATHAYIGHGSYRIDARLWPDDPVKWRADLDKAVAKARDCAPYLLDEPGVERVIFASITDGTGGATPTPQATAQLTTTVQELVAEGVVWFEGQNEPMGIWGQALADIYQAFHTTVHAAHPDAKVMGPCPVSITTPPEANRLGWLQQFLQAGGGNYIDGLSYHQYNAVENDSNQGRLQYQAFVDLLVQHGVDHLPRFMTEYGTFSSVYGSFEPHWQAQAVMLDWHLMWQVAGTHRNRTFYFYDLSHGFWAFPSWLIASGGGRGNPNPIALMFRTWVEETWGMELTETLDFGPVENRHYVGSRFTHADGGEALTIQSSGRFGTVTLAVTGATELTVVDHFGQSQTVVVDAGQAVIDVRPEPLHVQVPAGVTVSVVPADYGSDVTPRTTMQVQALTYGTNPAVAADNNLGTHWTAGVGDSGPSWWRANFAVPVTFDAVEVVCPPPWQHQGSLLDFDIHALVGGQWQVLHTEQVPVPNFAWTSHASAGGTWVDSYWDRRRIFVARLSAPVTASAVRVYARDFSFGGGATIDQARTLRKVDSQGRGTKIGQASRKRMTLQDVSLYLRP